MIAAHAMAKGASSCCLAATLRFIPADHSSAVDGKTIMQKGSPMPDKQTTEHDELTRLWNAIITVAKTGPYDRVWSQSMRRMLPPFGPVEGVPTGGLRFAEWRRPARALSAVSATWPPSSR